VRTNTLGFDRPLEIPLFDRSQTAADTMHRTVAHGMPRPSSVGKREVALAAPDDLR
jgi:hypothetical protein